MANPQLTPEQLSLANALLDCIREKLRETAGTDADFHWALRRKIAKELVYDERGKPNLRRALKAAKRIEQQGLCPECRRELPDT